MFKYYNIKAIIFIRIYILKIFFMLKKNAQIYIYIIIIFLYFLELHKLKEN